MSNDPDHAILGERTGRPRFLPGFGKPRMGSVMLHVCRVNQRNQYIDIKEKSNHGNSSRSRCTNSDVTLGPSGLTGRRGTPFRDFLVGSGGRNARRTSVEITSPTLFLSVAAISLAAASTSSSMAKVVRMVGYLLM